MKIFGLCLLLLGTLFGAEEELIIRAYRATDHFEEGKRLAEAPFASRFFEDHGELRDLTAWATRQGFVRGGEARAIFDPMERAQFRTLTKSPN